MGSPLFAGKDAGSTPAAAFLYPIQFRLRQFPAGISGIQGSRRFDQQDFAFFFGAGLVFHTLRDDHHFTGFQVQAFVPQVNAAISFDNYEDFVAMLLRMTGRSIGTLSWKCSNKKTPR